MGAVRTGERTTTTTSLSKSRQRPACYDDALRDENKDIRRLAIYHLFRRKEFSPDDLTLLLSPAESDRVCSEAILAAALSPEADRFALEDKPRAAGISARGECFELDNSSSVRLRKAVKCREKPGIFASTGFSIATNSPSPPADRVLTPRLCALDSALYPP